MGKRINYVKRIPRHLENYGLKVTVIKLCIDFAKLLRIPIPHKLRWNAANSFHTMWKIHQLNQYGIEEYNNRIDQKSLEVLNDFYETGTDFMNKTVVDIGCGTRGILPVIKARIKIGIDPTLNKLWGKFKFPQDVIYISQKAENISLQSNSIDIVVCNNTLNHVDNPELALAQIHRILKPGGYLLLEVFIEPENIAHTVEFTPSTLDELTKRYFTPINVKYEQLVVRVEIDETLNGNLPMRWGGVFKK